jgi:hypothetical protein
MISNITAARLISAAGEDFDSSVTPNESETKISGGMLRPEAYHDFTRPLPNLGCHILPVAVTPAKAGFLASRLRIRSPLLRVMT